MQNSTKKLPNNMVIYRKQQRSVSISNIFSFCLFNIAPLPLWYKTQLQHNVYYVDTRVWFISGCDGLVSRGNDVPGIKSFRFGWFYSQKMVILTPKSQILSQIPKYFCQILMVHYQAIKKTRTFCINQAVNFGADLGAYFLSKLNSYIYLVLYPTENGKVL